jgi:short-subunit dehydrogenase
MTALPRLAVVTGASSGIGAALVRALAARGEPVLAVARRHDRLEGLAAEALAAGHALIHTMALDLTVEGAPLALAAEARRLGVPWLLVNNAGFGRYGRFEGEDAAQLASMMRLNCESLVLLTHALLPDLKASGGGTVLNVASAAGFQATPYMSVYGATKAFVLSFTEGLDEELRGEGVRALAFCPGPVATEFGDVAGIGERFHAVPGRITAEEAAAAALQQLEDGEPVSVPGPLNKVATTLSQVLPRGVVRWASARLFRPAERP